MGPYKRTGFKEREISEHFDLSLRQRYSRQGVPAAPTLRLQVATARARCRRHEWRRSLKLCCPFRQCRQAVDEAD